MIRIKINNKVVGIYTTLAMNSMDNLIKAIKLHLACDWTKLEVEEIADKKPIKTKPIKKEISK